MKREAARIAALEAEDLETDHDEYDHVVEDEYAMTGKAEDEFLALVVEAEKTS